MKKISIMLNVILLVVLVSFIISGNASKSVVLADNADKVVQGETDYSDEDVYGKVDYPLLDIPIRYNNSDIVIIIANNVMHPDKAEYLFTDSKTTLESMQSTFNVISFPVARGTTPDSMVYIYQDNVLIREIPVFGIYTNEEKFSLDSLSKVDVEAKIKQELPPPI